MLSMCGLLCSVLRGWRHNQAVMLMARALSQANSSLLVQDLASGSGSGQVRGGVSSFCVAEGDKGLSQLLWCDNNKQAIMVSPRQCVDLQRWTLFLSSTTSEPLAIPSVPDANGTTGKDEEAGEDTTVTVLLEAVYRDRDEEVQPEYHVMVEQLSRPYAWKARDVFGVIVTTTPPQLLAMIQAFFNNALHIDDDFLIKKIITIEVVGEPASLADPLSIPECVTPGPWGAAHCTLTQMELARSLSPTGTHGLGSGAARTPGNSLRPPALWGLIRHQSSGESATSTSTTLHPQSSTDSERHQSSLDMQSSYDSVSDYPTSDTDDVACNVTGLYPRGWAVSGAHVVSGQPLSVRAALNQLHRPGQAYSIVTNPLEDLWQEEESRRATDDGCVGRQSVACLNGPSTVSYEVKSKTLPRARKSCGHHHSCLPGNVICQGVQPPQPGKREQDMVREAAQYYQRALDAAQVRQEGLRRDQSSASDEDFSFSGSRESGVVTQEPIKYPVRIKSEADLTRATSIIRDNLANIIQNYLFKPGTSAESQSIVSHLALDHPIIKLVSTHEGEGGSQLSTSGSTESKEGSSPPPLVVASGGQTHVGPLAPFHKAPLFRSKASPQYPLPKARSPSPGSAIQVVCLPGPHQKGESASVKSPCVVKKEKHHFTRGSKVTGKPSARGDKRLTKSEEIVLPPFIRGSHIDVPVTAEDDLTSNSSTAGGGCTVEYPHQHHITTTSIEEKEKKFDAAAKKLKEPVEVGSHGDTTASDTVTKIQEFALASASDASIVTRSEETTPQSDAEKTVVAASIDKSVAQKTQKAAVVSPSAQSMPSGPDTGTDPPASHSVTTPTPEQPVILMQPTASVPKIDSIPGIPDIAMIPPTPDTDTDSAPGTAITSVTSDTDLTPTTSDKDITQVSEAADIAVVSPETAKTSTTLKKDMTPLTSDTKVTPKLPGDPEMTQTLEDTPEKVPRTDMASKVPDLEVKPSSTTTVMPSAPDGTGRDGEECVKADTHVGKDEDGSNTPEAVVTIVHDGCISPVVESNLSLEGSSPASDSQGESNQRPRCLKDTHKLNTKSSTASESSFESLPYRMLSSQPESLTEDLAMGVSIELTRPPPDTERLRAARLELIRQERIHAISLMSTVTTDSEEGQVWAASLEEQPFGSPMAENDNQETWESPVLDSGVELPMQDSCIEHTTKPQPCSPTSPTESAPESGFSSLRETVVEGSGRGARGGVCLSKSKDSLDLTDGDRCPGTDTFSDDMETLSSSAGEATLMESGPVSRRASPRSSVSDSTHQDSGLAVPTQAPHHESKMSKELEGSSGLLTEEKSKYLSDDSGEYMMKTSESLSSEDTVVSRPSLDDHIQGCQEDTSETQEDKASILSHLHPRGEAEKGLKEPRNGNGGVEDKWEPHHTWPPGVCFTSQALHTSIADKLRLLSESEADTNTRSHSRARRTKRAMSAAAGNTLGLPVSKGDPCMKADAQISPPQESHTQIPKRSSVSDCKQTKPHSSKRNEEVDHTAASTHSPGQSTTTKNLSSAPDPGQCTSVKTHSTVHAPDQCTNVKTHSSAPVPDQCTTVKTHSSASIHDQDTTVQTHNNVPAPDQSTTTNTYRKAPVPIPGQHTAIKTHSSAPVSDQLNEQTHSAPDSVQSSDMKPLSSVSVPGSSTSVQTPSTPSVPSQATPTTAAALVHSITSKTHTNAHVPSQSTTAHTPSSVPAPSQSTSARTHSTVLVPDGTTITSGPQLTGTTAAAAAAAAARVPAVPVDNHSSSSALRQQERLPQKQAAGVMRDPFQANNLPPILQSTSAASIHLQETTVTTTITTSSSISSTTTTTTISSITEGTKGTDLKRGGTEKDPRGSVTSRVEKNKEPLIGEASPRNVGDASDSDGKPRLQRMAHLERTDTSGSPTTTRTPTPPVCKSESTSKAHMSPALQHLAKRNGNLEMISRTINDTTVRPANAGDADQDLREGGDKTRWNRGLREAKRGGSEEAPARSHIPNLRKYGSEELSRATPDSYCSSNSKSYLEPDLSSMGSFQSTGGSLELLEGSPKGCRSSRTYTSMTAAQSQELARCEQVSLKSQGSLDKFPHFDQVSASQRQVTPRRKGVSVDDSGAGKGEHLHRSFTLPGSLASPRRDEKKKEKEDKGKRKKKEKEKEGAGVGGGEKKSAMMSLKGLLRRNKPKEKEKEGTQERLSSPSLFRRLERRSKSGSPSPLSDSSTHQPRPGNSPSSSPVDSTSRSPIVANGKIRPVISSPVALQQPAPVTAVHTIATNTASPSRGVAASCSDSESASSSTPASPQRRVCLARAGGLSQPSPRLYKHVLTRNLSSSQESLDSSILSSAQSSPHASPHGSPQRCVIPASASSLSLPAARELSPPAPVMGTRALRGSSSSFSVTIGFRPQIERRRGQRTVSEGADLNRVSLSPGPRRGEGSRVLTQLGKRSSSMEILVCGKIREHCPDSSSSHAGPRAPFSREGSFRLHREISVETLFEVPEGGGAGGSPEDYRRYLDHVRAARHGSSSSLAEEPSPAPEPPPRHRMRKYSVPQGMHLSGMREAAMSNPNLQRSTSPLVRGMSHSSTFSSSPLRRPSSATPAYSPAKRALCSSTGGSQAGEVGGAPLMRVEEEGPHRKNLDSATDKPPNVLVYAANNVEYYGKVQQTMNSCLNPDRYTIYHLTDELAFKSPWSGSTTLLVVCGDVPAHISTVFIRYLLQGGRVLSVCSDFLNMAVPLFGTVEVQEQAVVSVSYQRWNSVHLLHHQHCFHSSPRNKRFSRNTEAALKDPANRSAVSVEPTHVEIIDEYGGRHRLDLLVLATDDTWGAPTLLSAKVHGGQGTAVFSQVHLEHDPQASLPASSEATSRLAGSNTARLEILQELLATELSLDTSSHPTVAYTPAYFLGRHQQKEELLSHLRPHMDGEELPRSRITMQFVMPGSVPKHAAHNLLPILTSACPLTFSTVKYFETLDTTSLGRLVIYCEVVSSSMRVVAGNPPLVHGLVVLPTQQTHGQGRGGNVWLSPLGCAMFSIQLHLALSSMLGLHLSFLQHLVALAVVQAVVTIPGYTDIPLRLKWPNDIYLGSHLKIGGVVVEATTAGAQVIVNVGCGVNLSNSNPTGCLNDAIRQYNQEHNTDLPELEREVFLARVFNTLESLIDTFQTRGPGAVQPIYYKYWLHSNAVVTVQSEHRQTQSAEVVGVDSYGFLQARLPSGETITLQPDGNSFDMMEGLVYSKVK